ncbi:hypothetical protein GMRT_10871 [Giardia muris]|uniref:Uncharacterized protein n=1 Tax=Giardia muris TaxID=5742 RepID=A0A4Z1T7Q8_GIAMU|nr:hypothetical protein GMRT_10871 [Giardia muris]|eukprot:TNJ28609.1 hypothetical protein GMRT_10871 [Giardia muris]
MPPPLNLVLEALDKAIALVDSSCEYAEAFARDLTKPPAEVMRELEMEAKRLVENGRQFTELYINLTTEVQKLDASHDPGASVAHLALQTVASFVLCIDIAIPDLYAKPLVPEMLDSTPLRKVRRLVSSKIK